MFCKIIKRERNVQNSYRRFHVFCLLALFFVLFCSFPIHHSSKTLDSNCCTRLAISEDLTSQLELNLATQKDERQRWPRQAKGYVAFPRLTVNPVFVSIKMLYILSFPFLYAWIIFFSFLVLILFSSILYKFS